MAKIALIGMMGSGKSFVGKELASRLKMTFVDIDQQIEEKANSKIGEIFAQKGEEYFRDLESEFLTKVLNDKQDFVIACGGGVILREENRRKLQKNAKTICLAASSRVIFERLKSDETRPLLKEISLEKIEKILKDRKKYYEMADFCVTTDSNDLNLVVNEVLQCIR